MKYDPKDPRKFIQHMAELEAKGKLKETEASKKPKEKRGTPKK